VTLAGIVAGEATYLTVCADDVSVRLADLRGETLAMVREQAILWPVRWRSVLRRLLVSDEHAAQLTAAALLDEIGEATDVPLLRAFAHRSRSPQSANLGRGLARRIAPVAHVGDLGHVVLHVGDRVVDGSAIRRKVLTLACFLLTRPGFAATRDQVLEALWPDLEPGVAVNSLNQTVYFLRRVLEPGYKEDESANYVVHDGEVVRLDPNLVTAQSAVAHRLIVEARSDLDPASVERLSLAYVGRFGLDFEYEDWASPFRETLHASYLDVVEQAVRSDTASGHFDRAAVLARRAIAVDQTPGALETSLLRLYRDAGSHAAAAEQYSHYAAAAHEDGLPATALEAL